MAKYIIEVSREGIRPARLRVAPGDTVEWQFAEPGMAVVPVEPDFVANAPLALPWTGEVNDFTGPFGRLIGGLHMINQPRQADPQQGDNSLPDWIWDEPAFTSVYIRLNWKLINPRPEDLDPDPYDWSWLDPHMDNAVRTGKYFSVSVRAGVQETPGWLFNDGLGALKCHRVKLPGKSELGLPQDPNYRHWWYTMTRALIAHIKSRNDWWQRFTGIRVSGANDHSAEAKLPHTKGDDPSTEGWDEMWADHGFTPEGQMAFYAEQGDMLVELCPGKDILYPLIHDGWPDKGMGWKATELTTHIINQGRDLWGNRWVVQHLGLQPLRDPPNTLPYSDSHPVTTTRGVKVGDGNPNQWALRAGIAGSPTAGQTNNDIQRRAGAEAVGRCMVNAWENSDYIWVELYDKDTKFFHDDPSMLCAPTGLTLQEWSQRFQEWRTERWDAEVGPAMPISHQHTFTRTLPAGQKQRHYYTLSGDPSVRAVIEVV